MHARHRDRAAPEGRREEVSRTARPSGAWSRPIRTTSCFRSSSPSRRGEDEPKTEQINSASALWQRSKSELKPEDYRQGLPDHRARLRRARDDAALSRRGPLLLRGAAVRAVDAAVRPVRSRSRKGHVKLYVRARLHHRRRRPAAVLPALHPRRGRQRGPAAQHLARDAAEQSAGRRDPQGLTGRVICELETLAEKDAEAFEQGVGGVRPGAEGRHLRGLRAARATAPRSRASTPRPARRARSSSTSRT